MVLLDIEPHGLKTLDIAALCGIIALLSSMSLNDAITSCYGKAFHITGLLRVLEGNPSVTGAVPRRSFHVSFNTKQSVVQTVYLPVI